jgi:hypothetical protein
MRSHSEMSYRLQKRLLGLPIKAAVALLLASILQSASAEVEVSVMTIDGVVRSLAPASPASQLTRNEIAEDGRSISVDEFAIVASENLTPAFVSEGLTADHVNHLAAALHTVADVQAVDQHAVDRKTHRARTPLLVVQHQRGHPANSNFAPAPFAAFDPQPVSSKQLEGQRGFAVITIGESGKILAVKTLNEEGLTSNAQLRRALASGIKTSFQDERRHDHTVYLAYEVREQTISRVGRPIVTLPMCNCP